LKEEHDLLTDELKNVQKEREKLRKQLQVANNEEKKLNRVRKFGKEKENDIEIPSDLSSLQREFKELIAHQNA